MGIRDLERRIHAELEKAGFKLPARVDRFEYSPLVRRLARMALGQASGLEMTGAVFRTIATDWYRQAKRSGYFRNDFQEDRRREHSFWSFATYLDSEWAIGVAPRTPWVRAVQWYRKVRYNFKKLLKHK